MVIASIDTPQRYSFWTDTPTRIKISNYVDLLNDSGAPAACFVDNDLEVPKGYTDTFTTLFTLQIAPDRLPNKPIITKLNIIPKDTKHYKSVTKILQWSLG